MGIFFRISDILLLIWRKVLRQNDKNAAVLFCIYDAVRASIASSLISVKRLRTNPIIRSFLAGIALLLLPVACVINSDR